MKSIKDGNALTCIIPTVKANTEASKTRFAVSFGSPVGMVVITSFDSLTDAPENTANESRILSDKTAGILLKCLVNKSVDLH